MGQREDGLRSLEQARALRVKVVQDNPTNSQFQGDLADSYLTIGLIERETDPAAARRSLEEARGIALKLCQADPSIARFQSLLAEIYNGLGLAQQTADPAAAQHCYEQACGHLEKLVQGIAARMDQLPAVRQYQVALAQSYHNLGTLRREMKQPAAARRSFEQACVLWDWVLERDKGLAGDRVRLRRALTQAYLGEHARATDTVKGITQKLPGAGNLLYDAACVYSMSAATCLEDARLDPVDQSRLAQHYAQQAVALLTRVCTAGYFRSPTAVERLRNAPEMAMLRSREDFRRLLNDLEPIKQAGR